MKIASKAGSRWPAILVVLPLALLVVLAIATGSFVSAGSAVYGVYGVDHVTPGSSYGLSDQMLYVANGSASDVKVIDVATMSIVDSIAVPDQPDGLAGLGMNWEVHGVVPSQDRTSIYAVGALSGGYLAGAPYQMYEIDASTDAVTRSIPLADSAYNPVGYCGLEYNLEDEGSSEIVGASMNAADATLMSIGAPDLGRPPAQEVGGWSYEDISGAGSATGFMSSDFNGNQESSTCGISWNAAGDRAFAAQMFEPLVNTVAWSSGAGTVDGSFPSTSSMYHQTASDTAAGRLYVASSAGTIDMFDMNTNAAIGSIDIKALTNSTTNDVHGVEVAPGNSNVIYVTSRNTPTGSGAPDNKELVVDITNLAAPTLIGAVGGLADGVCGVYAIPDKQSYYAANNPVGTGNEMLFIANGDASDVKVVDVGSMSIVDSIAVPDQPDGLAGLGMVWEVHGAVPSQDRTSIYAVGALSGGYLAGAPYQMYEINTASDALERSIPLADSAYNPVGYCGLEYNLEDESSSEIVAASMNSADATLMSIGAPDLGRPPAQEVGGWSYEDISGAGSATGFMSSDFNGNQESSTCGISWNAAGDRAFAAQMFEPLVNTVAWSSGAGTVDGSIPASSAPGTSYHQSASDTAAGHLYVASSSGRVDVFDMNTNAAIGSVNIRDLTGTYGNDVHGVEVSPTDSNIIYVTSRNTPDNGDNMELVIDITDLNAPVLKGSIGGFADGACGVYAIPDKSAYYGTQPALTLSKTATYWASYAAYEAGQLSVDYSIGNGGSANASNVAVAGTVNTNGVTMVSASGGGDIAGGGSAPATIVYQLPSAGVGSFKSTVYATAQNGGTLFNYPGPYPGP